MNRDGVAEVGHVAQDFRVRGGMLTDFATSRAHWMNCERMDDLCAGNDLNIWFGELRSLTETRGVNAEAIDSGPYRRDRFFICGAF
jgi:hypothetical protein